MEEEKEEEIIDNTYIISVPPCQLYTGNSSQCVKPTSVQIINSVVIVVVVVVDFRHTCPGFASCTTLAMVFH